MAIPDPLDLVDCPVLYSIDRATAEAFTGRKRMTWSRLAAEPLVRLGVDEDDAVAAVHWSPVTGPAMGVLAVLTQSGGKRGKSRWPLARRKKKKKKKK